MLKFATQATLWVGALVFMAVAIPATEGPITLRGAATMAVVLLVTVIVHALLKRLDDRM